MTAVHLSSQLRFTVLASGEGWHVQDLRRAAEKVGVELQSVLFRDLSIEITIDDKPGNQIEIVRAGSHRLDDQDAILVRMMPPSGLERVVFRMDALHRLCELGVPVYNPPRTVEMAVDKALSLARLAGVGVAVPRTWVGESPDDAIIAFERLGGNVICKPIFGSEGRGLVRIENREMAWRAAHGLAQLGSVVYFQEYIQNNGSDLRVMILNGEPLAAMRRIAPKNDWRTNVAQGAQSEALKQISQEVAEIAIKVAEVTGGMMVGVDLMQSPDGRWYVLEVNAVPGWRALSAVTCIDVAAEWLLAVKQRAFK